MSIPYMCVSCKKTDQEVKKCRIRLVQFNVFGRKCPREEPIEEAIPSLKEPKLAGFEPATPKETVARTEVLTTNIRLANLETRVFSPRKVFSMRYVDELAESIEKEGQLKPIIVRPNPEKPNVYQVIDGEHRVRAFRKLGRSLIRAEVRMLSDEEADLLAMRINEMHGKRLEDLEEGLHIKKMMEQHGWSQRDIAERLRRSLGWVNGRLALVDKLSPETKEAFTRVNITKRKAIEIAELPKEIQPAVVTRVINEGLSFKDTQTLVHAIKDYPESKEEILAKPINELTPPPKDIQEFEEEHGPEQPKFETGQCPYCGAEYVVNWPLCRILRKLKDRLFDLPLMTLKDEVDRLAEEYSKTWRVICGDAFQEIQRLIDEQQLVDLVITDPPYNISAPNKVIKRRGEIVEADIAEWDHQTREEYEGFIRRLLKSIRDVLKPTGSFYIFLDKAFSGKAWFMAEELGLKPRNIVHWVKTNPTPHARKNNYLSAVEHILFGTKSNQYTFNFTTDNEMHNFIQCPIAGGRERLEYPNPTAKPVELIEHLIKVSSRVNDVVLDCFAGRGTTGIAALKQKRNCILIESDPTYCRTIERWIHAFLVNNLSPKSGWRKTFQDDVLEPMRDDKFLIKKRCVGGIKA